MAGEEDVELRDLVAQTLETRGVLGKIRAQLRASVFLALEEQDSQQNPHPLVSSKLQQYLKTKDGQLTTALVREFLNFFDLDYTCSVFDPETNALETCPGRNQLARDLGLDISAPTGPLLDTILQRATSTVTTQPLSTDSLTSAPRQSSPPDLPPPPESTNYSHVSSQGSGVGTGDPALNEAYNTNGSVDRNNGSGSDLNSGKQDQGASHFSSSDEKLFDEGLRQVTNGGDIDDGLDDFFDKRSTDMDLRELDSGKLDKKESYHDDFHCDRLVDQLYDRSQVQSNSKLDETEDMTISQTSLTDFDYTETAN